MRNTPSRTTSFLLADRNARVPQPPADPLLARLDQAVLSLAALAARPQFHAETRVRAGLGGRHFPEHPARRVDPALYGVLAALAGDGMPGPSSIAVRLGLHPSTVSHHLDTLQRRGLVERRPYFGHRKWRDVALTPLGKEAYTTIRDARHEALAALIAAWTTEEKKELTAVVGRLADAVRVHSLRVHEQALDERREVAARRTPKEIERARAAAHERYAREKAAAQETERRRAEIRRRCLRVGASDPW